MRLSISYLSKISFSLLLSAVLCSCAPRLPSSATTSGTSSNSVADCISSGDLVVSNSGSDAVLVLDSLGNYKAVAYNVVNTSESMYGLAWQSSTGELLIAVDGADRIMAIDRTDCSSRIMTADSNLSGTIRGLMQLLSGDILIVESNNVERFSSSGLRITTGSWPKSLQTGGTGIHSMTNGGFVHCSNGSDVVRTYDSSGTQIATKSSGITPTDAQDCIEMSGGNIAVSWSGTNDTVAIYSSDLTTTVATYSDTNTLSTPRGIAQRSNGNLLVLDNGFHYIVELTSSGSFVDILADTVLNAPEFIVVAP